MILPPEGGYVKPPGFGSVEYGEKKGNEDSRQLGRRDDEFFHKAPGNTPMRASVIRTAI